MIRPLAIGLVAVLGGVGALPESAPNEAGPATLAEAGADARRAWERRDFSAFVGAAAGNRLVVSLPTSPASAPLPPDQAAALLAAYVQGTEEVSVAVLAAAEVDSTRGFVRLERRYRLVGVPAERTSMVLLAYRRGRDAWILTEVRVTT
jgi:hypothetical protein